MAWASSLNRRGTSGRVQPSNGTGLRLGSAHSPKIGISFETGSVFELLSASWLRLGHDYIPIQRNRVDPSITPWYTENVDHNISIRFRSHQLISKRDDSYVVDYGTTRIETDDGIVTDVEYRMVPTSAPTTFISSVVSGQSDGPVLRSGIRLGPEP